MGRWGFVVNRDAVVCWVDCGFAWLFGEKNGKFFKIGDTMFHVVQEVFRVVIE